MGICFFGISYRERRKQIMRELSTLLQYENQISNQRSNQLSNRQNLMMKPRHFANYFTKLLDAFFEDDVVYLAVEYSHFGSLQDIVDSGGCRDETSLANISVQAVRALAEVHSHHQIHRNIKPGDSAA
jgi:serine/threonine protein kinase